MNFNKSGIEYALFLIIPFFYLFILFPNPPSLTTSIVGGNADPVSFLWIFHRFSENILHGNYLFDGKILFPSSDSLIFSESMPFSSLIYRSFFIFSGNKILSFNLTLITFLLLNYFTMYLFCRLFLSKRASVFSAVVFAFSMVRIVQLHHIHLLPQFFTPLVGICIFQYERKSKTPFYLGLCAFFLALQFYFSISLGMILMVSLFPYFSWKIFTCKEERKNFFYLAVFLFLVSPLAFSYYRVSFENHFSRGLDEARMLSAYLKSFFIPPDGHYLSSILNSPGRFPEEKRLFIGFFVMFFMGFGIVKLLDLKDPIWLRFKKTAFGSLLFSMILSLGPVAGIYAILYFLVPGMKGIRVPARFGLSYLFYVSILAGIGLQSICIKHLRIAKLMPLIFPLFFLDNLIPVRLSAIPPDLYDVSMFLKSKPDDQAVLFLPFQDVSADTLRMYHGLNHHHPIVNGYCGFLPKSYQHIKNLVENPDSGTLSKLLSQGIRYVALQKRSENRLKLFNTRKIFEDNFVVLYDISHS